MRPLAEMPRETLAGIRAVFFDIDDTFSTNLGGGENRIEAEAYAALWALHKKGIKCVPVTGRPAGWCDMIARMWPVDAIVGENGAFYLRMDFRAKTPKLVKKYLESEAVRRANEKKLIKLRHEILKKFPGAQTPSDQGFREFDLAIDFCEDVKRWPDKKVQALLEFARAKGAQAKLSSIHVNIWFGRYDKWTCVRKVMQEFLKLEPARDLENVIYVGDSPNDEPFFSRMPLTLGVANIRHFEGKMQHLPAYVASREGGKGFAELAERILNA